MVLGPLDMAVEAPESLPILPCLTEVTCPDCACTSNVNMAELMCKPYYAACPICGASWLEIVIV